MRLGVEMKYTFNNAAPPNRRPRFPFATARRLGYAECAPPASPAAVGEPQCWASMRTVTHLLSSCWMVAACIAVQLACFVASAASTPAAEDQYFPLASGLEWLMDLRAISPH